MASDPTHAHTRGSSRYTTPLAAPPPPLHLLSAQQGRGTHNMHLPAYAGARHTLGPMFNDEEDGDDSAFIAQQMALLGLDQQQQQQQGGGAGVRRRASTTQPGERNNGNNNRRGGRRQQQQHQQQQQGRAPRQDHHHQQQQQAASAAYLVQQAQQHALLAAQMQMQIGAAPPSHQAQILAAQQYQMQLQLAALQLHQQQQQQNGRYVSSPSPNPQYSNSQSGLPRPQRSTYPSASDMGNRQAQDSSASRARRQNNLDDAETRARFEAAPNVNRDAGRASNPKQQQQQQSHPFAPLPLPASSSNSWRSSSTGAASTEHIKPPTPALASGSRFAQVPPARGMSGESSSSDSLQASTEDMYSLMSTEPTTAHTSPKSAASELQDKSDPNATPSAMAIGLGRPLSVPSHYDATSASARLRAWSSPVTSHTPLVPAEQPRGASNPVITSTSHVIVVRQPFGPPGSARDLQDKNFKAVLRKRAGLGLHMLNRRSSPLMPIIALEDDE